MDDPALNQSNNPQMPNVQSTADDLAQLTKDPLPSFADEIKTFDETHPQSGKFKEQLEALGGMGSERSSHQETPVSTIEEIPVNPEIEPSHEIASYVEKIEHEAELGQAVTDDYTQQVLLKSSVNQNPVVTLPLSEDQIQKGLHHQVWEAIRWLAVWCVRQAKLLHGRVKYKGTQ